MYPKPTLVLLSWRAGAACFIQPSDLRLRPANKRVLSTLVSRGKEGEEWTFSRSENWQNQPGPKPCVNALLSGREYSRSKETLRACLPAKNKFVTVQRASSRTSFVRSRVGSLEEVQQSGADKLKLLAYIERVFINSAAGGVYNTDLSRADDNERKRK